MDMSTMASIFAEHNETVRAAAPLVVSPADMDLFILRRVIDRAQEVTGRVTASKTSCEHADFIQTLSAERLIIKEIVIEDSKSYWRIVDRSTFEKGFSPVIYSETMIDAILFFFGQPASKIYIRNPCHWRNLNHCIVSVNFQKILDTGVCDDQYTVLPNSEFVVSKKVYSYKSPKYFLDNDEVTYAEVTQVFKDSGFDLDHSRLIFVQGELEKIAMMKPKALTEQDEGLLEYLENIISTDTSRQDNNIMSRRPDISSDTKFEQLDRVNAAGNEVEILNKTVEFLSLENATVDLNEKLLERDSLEFCDTKNSVHAKYIKEKEFRCRLSKMLRSVREFRSKKTDEYNKMKMQYLKLLVTSMKPREKISELMSQGIGCKEYMNVDMFIIEECANEKKTMEVMKINIKGLEKLEAEMAEEELHIKLKEDMYFREIQENRQFISMTKKEQDCYNTLHKQRQEKFMAGFQIIAGKLKEVYKTLCPGGDAELMLVDSLRPLSGGVIFRVRPPQKSWMNTSSLSVNERIQSSLALVFALHLYKPAPFYFVHGIHQVVKYENLQECIKKFAKNTQFITFSTENEDMFQRRSMGHHKMYDSSHHW